MLEALVGGDEGLTQDVPQQYNYVIWHDCQRGQDVMTIITSGSRVDVLLKGPEPDWSIVEYDLDHPVDIEHEEPYLGIGVQ